MKKLLKLALATVLILMLFGCIFVIEPNEITITNNTGYTLNNIFIVPEDDYYIPSTATTTTYNAYYNAFSGYIDILGSETLAYTGSITIDLDDYLGSGFRLISFDTTDPADVYATYIDDTISSESIVYSDHL